MGDVTSKCQIPTNNFAWKILHSKFGSFCLFDLFADFAPFIFLGGIDTPHISQGFNPPCFPPGQSPHQKDNSFCGVGTWLPKRPEEPNFSSLTWQRAPPYGRVKIFWGSLHFLSTFFFPQIASFNYRGSNTSSWGGEGSLPNFFFGQFHVVADTITYGRKERNTFTRWWGSQIW